MKIIGKVESCYLDKFGTPRQAGLVPDSFGKIILDSTFQPEVSLQGLEEFSHLWVIFIFHQNQNLRFHAKVHPPRLLGESRGVFATRSPHRPNPIGLSLVKIEKIQNQEIWVSGLDLVNDTPVIDIKPYLPFIESIPHAKGGWAEQTLPVNIEVLFPEDIEQELERFYLENQYINLKQLIKDTLKLDPRPIIYRGYEEEKNSPYRTQHAVRIICFDIHFEFISKNEIKVLSMTRIKL